VPTSWAGRAGQGQGPFARPVLLWWAPWHADYHVCTHCRCAHPPASVLLCASSEGRPSSQMLSRTQGSGRCSEEQHWVAGEDPKGSAPGVPSPVGRRRTSARSAARVVRPCWPAEAAGSLGSTERTPRPCRQGSPLPSRPSGRCAHSPIGRPPRPPRPRVANQRQIVPHTPSETRAY